MPNATQLVRTTAKTWIQVSDSETLLSSVFSMLVLSSSRLSNFVVVIKHFVFYRLIAYSSLVCGLVGGFLLFVLAFVLFFGILHLYTAGTLPLPTICEDVSLGR